MKFVRVGLLGAEKAGVIDDDGKIRDISSMVEDVNGKIFSDATMAQLKGCDLSLLPVLTEARYGQCIAGVGKVICVGLNYYDHAVESGMEVPEEPMLFMKAASSLCGANDSVVMPIGGEKLDYEIELGVVIGKTTKNVSPDNAGDHIGGFCIFNDVSERAFQLEGTGQWMKGKSCDTFGPCGPWLVTPDEIGDVANLNLELLVNGEVRQKANTKDMLFSVPDLIAFISRFMTLHPGDLIVTGTPPGVVLGMDPQVYMKPGDKMSLMIEGLGTQSQEIVGSECA